MAGGDRGSGSSPRHRAASTGGNPERGGQRESRLPAGRKGVGMQSPERGQECKVLNAVRHKDEAAVVALAGESGRITIATNMAGRGTDLKIGQGRSEEDTPE